MKKYMKIIMLFSVTSLFGFEVNTHQALIRCAITNECNQNGVKNLADFSSFHNSSCGMSIGIKKIK